MKNRNNIITEVHIETTLNSLCRFISSNDMTVQVAYGMREGSVDLFVVSQKEAPKQKKMV
jgi:hypothetical protein